MSNEHVDNYLAEIERAKAELNTINQAIEKAKAAKSDIETGNTEILSVKLAQLADRTAECNQLRHDANELHAKNSLLTEQLEKLHEEHAKDVAELNANKEQHALYVKNKENDIQAREISLNNMADNLNTQALELDTRYKGHDELNTQLMNNAKANEESLAALKEQQAIIEEAIEKRTKIIEEFKIIHEQVEAGKQDSYNTLLNARECLVEASKKEQAAKETLEAVNVKEEALKDTILQSKKEQIDAMKLSERANKNLTEANLKIAELKELREAMAQQEK